MKQNAANLFPGLRSRQSLLSVGALIAASALFYGCAPAGGGTAEASPSATSSADPKGTITVPTPTALRNPITRALGTGDHGPRVQQLQQDLNLIGCRDMRRPNHPVRLRADKRFGKGTESAVMEVQENLGLNPDGVAGRLTLPAIDTLVTAHHQAPTPANTDCGKS